MKRTTTEKNIPLCLGVHYFFCGLSPENSSQLHNTFIHHISLSILAPASSSATNKVGHPATYVPGLQNEEIVPRLLSIALCATSSCYAHNAAKSAHHRNAETPWTLRRDVDFFRIKSQKHQDGALAYIFQNIGVTNKFYVEFGFNADNFFREEAARIRTCCTNTSGGKVSSWTGNTKTQRSTCTRNLFSPKTSRQFSESTMFPRSRTLCLSTSTLMTFGFLKRSLRGVSDLAF